MSLYGTGLTIGGVTCGMVLRGSANGRYIAVFEREYASLEDIEAIDWSQPEVVGECVLPAGYGFCRSCWTRLRAAGSGAPASADMSAGRRPSIWTDPWRSMWTGRAA